MGSAMNVLPRTARWLAAAAIVAIFAFVLAGRSLADDFVDALQQRLLAESGNSSSDTGDLELLAIYKFYETRNYQPAWIDETGPTDSAKTVSGLMLQAGTDGLVADDYKAARIAERLGATSVPDRADLEVLLSRSFVRYANDLGVGRVVPSEIDQELLLSPQRRDPAVLLAEAAAAPDIARYLADLQRPSPEYLRLKQALADYRAAAARGGWTQVPDGDSLKPGMSGPRVLALRKRLVEGGDLAAGSENSDQYDPTVEEAVKQLQYRHGLEPDGAAGKATIAELNVPIEARIDQILLNLERRRWMPRDPGQKYLFVNLADFELKVVDGPKTVFDTKVVVGTPFHRSPVFSANMTYIVLNPEWNITPTIARNEMLPKIRRDVGYLAKNHIRLYRDWSGEGAAIDPYSIDWSRVSQSNFPYKLVQSAGRDNALGHIKFMFPNSLNIYLHDTPSRDLFNKTVRSFSHGCIRVQNPVDLAAVLLGPDGWTKEKLQAAIDSGERRIVTLSTPIPVHLTYLTAWANKDGTVNFRNDIYGRDKRLADALDGPRGVSR